MIWRDIPPFIDGRAELYGEKLVLTYFNAVEGKKIDELFKMLDEYGIEATLLVAGSPAALILDQAQGWQRLYADENAVVHVRTAAADATPAKMLAPFARPQKLTARLSHRQTFRTEPKFNSPSAIRRTVPRSCR